MLGNGHVRFLGGPGAARRRAYPTKVATIPAIRISQIAASGTHENAFRKRAPPMQRCRRLTAGTAPARALGSSEAIARLGWP